MSPRATGNLPRQSLIHRALAMGTMSASRTTAALLQLSGRRVLLAGDPALGISFRR